jgi:hypothetical protein
MGADIDDAGGPSALGDLRSAGSASATNAKGAIRSMSSMRRQTAGVAALRSACGMRIASPALLISTSSRR